jgi:hypothetical protein
VWDRLQKQVAVELEQLNYLLQTHRPLLSKCESIKPDSIELSALAAMLHAFYTGIENILRRVTVELDGEPPKGEFWHRQLLDKMAHPGPARLAVISTPLRDALRDYLYFRHVFRQAYTFELRWEKMAGLVEGCENILHQLELELNTFFESFKNN